MCSGDGVYQRIASWAHGIGAASIEDSAIEVGFDEHFPSRQLRCRSGTDGGAVGLEN
jgi:hypothetical protein